MSTTGWPILTIGCAEGKRPGAAHPVPEADVQRILGVLRDEVTDSWLAEHDRAVAAAAWDEGRESLAMDIASPRRDDMTKRSTENPYQEVTE